MQSFSSSDLFRHYICCNLWVFLSICLQVCSTHIWIKWSWFFSYLIYECISTFKPLRLLIYYVILIFITIDGLINTDWMRHMIFVCHNTIDYLFLYYFNIWILIYIIFIMNILWLYNPFEISIYWLLYANYWVCIFANWTYMHIKRVM